jgi:hypothetical protein
MTLGIPTPMKTEHDHLHQRLVALTREPGPVGAAAREVARALHPHFVKEEAFALPPLGLLTQIARSGVTPAMAEVLPLTQRLEAEFEQMLREHGEIVAVLEPLAAAGRAERNAEAVAFAEALLLHAQIEEQVLYPAALLVGERVAAALGK